MQRIPQDDRPTQETPTNRARRGYTLAFDRFEEIESLRPHVWRVPSCTGDHCYLVDLKHGTCSCEDSIFGGQICKHQFAARIVHAKTATCSGCGERVRRRDLEEVQDWHESLSYFEGDLLCPACFEGSDCW